MKEKDIQEEKQLDLGFQEPISNKIKSRKYKIELFFLKIRTNSLLKNPAMWTLGFLIIGLIATQNYYYANYSDKIPSEIPLLQIRDELDLRLVNKDFLSMIIIFSIILTIISMIISIKTYNKNKILSLMLLGNLFIAITFITIAYIKIFGIYLF